MRYIVFWFANFIFDSINYIIPCIVLVIIIVAFQLDDLKSFTVLGHVFSLFIFYGLGIIPMMYLMSFYFVVPSSGYTALLFFNILTGMAPISTNIFIQICTNLIFKVAVTILSIPELELVHVADGLE